MIENLERISDGGLFKIVAMDHRDSLRSILNPQNPLSVPENQMKETKILLAKTLSKKASAVILDPIYGLDALKVAESGVILSIERSGYSGTEEERVTELLAGWFVRKLRDVGANAVKILVYYKPGSGTAKHQEGLVRRVYEDCRKNDLPLICEFLLYPSKNDEDIINTARIFSKICDVVKTEAPEEKKNCLKLSDSLDKPWIALSRGVPFNEFKDILKKACEGGASGFAAGRGIWGDVILEDEETFKKISLERLGELNRIVEENATSWYEKI